MAHFRYLVRDVDAGVAFYREPFKFELREQFGSSMAIIARGDLASTVTTLRARGVTFRNEVVAGPGGRQILCEDPSGNCLELFQPA